MQLFDIEAAWLDDDRLGDQGIMPKELTLRNLELFATKVMPEFR